MLNKKTILIAGGTGSWGNELTSQILERYKPKQIIIFSRGEHKQVEMKIKYSRYKNIKYCIGDVRDKDRLSIISKGVDYIFHLSALKHVPVCEENPWESVQTNINGTKNIIDVAIQHNIKKVVYVSTDKAVDPLNIYGMCKAISEKLIINANLESNKTSFVCIRGGNVIGTNGSVIPLFKSQISKNNELTITHLGMSRFFLSLKEAISLLFKATEDAIGGEIFVMKMPSMYIQDLANVMIELYGNKKTKIKIIGLRPGEKESEILVSEYEAKRCIKSGNYYIILPQIQTNKIKRKYSKKKLFEIREFNSVNAYVMDNEEIKEILKTEDWINRKAYFNKDLSNDELKNPYKKEGWQNGK